VVARNRTDAFRPGLIAGPAPHAVEPLDVLVAVGSSPDGLGRADAEARFEQDGPNTLPGAPGAGIWRVFLRQFASPLIYVLLLAAALSAWLREWSDAGFIAAVLLLNALIGTAQENRAERSAQALRTMVSTRTDVVRDGDVFEIDARELVIGDVVLLASGAKVPADLRLLETHSLRVDESPLTGESLPVDKAWDAEVQPTAPLADRPTMVYAGTLVRYGRGVGVVVATAGATQLGALAGRLREPSLAEPPLLARMRRFTLAVGVVVGLVALAIGAVELTRGTAWHDVMMVGVALAVSAVPEGLPVALTVALAVAAHRMARRHVIVRRLVAIESLGSCTVIASDKTGTLTANELMVTHVAVPGGQPREVTGSGVDPAGVVLVPEQGRGDEFAAVERIARATVLCNEATLADSEDGWVHRGDAVDVAMLVLGHKLGITRPVALEGRPQLAALPFESERGYAATLHAVDEVTGLVVVKGAGERLLAMCSRMATPNGEVPLDARATTRVAEQMAGWGERVVAVATGKVDRHLVDELDHEHLAGLTLLGLVGMSDPLRPDSAAAVAACRGAGIQVIMVTGDHPRTALTIARELGLADRADEVVTGDELREAGDEELDRLVADARVFARVEPGQKLAIVASLTRQGHVVAVTGDGANDAPALHHAHVGVAMGRSGTDVAREAAELVVTDDRFGSIAAGVEEGRIAYANVRKVVLLLIATGAGELVLMLAAITMGLPLPLLAVQLLWLNLVTNGIQDVALAFEPAEGDEMRRRPRPPDEPIFNRLMVERVLLSAVVIGGVTLGVYKVLLAQGWSVDEARNSAVLLMVLFENVYVFVVRSELRSTFAMDPRRNLFLVVGTVLAQVVHIAAMHVPLTRSVLGLQPVSWEHWVLLFLLALSLVAVVEAHKMLCRRRVGC
jgi:magnesium-transporting ATPase (P-type)